ncbi:thiamine pyrophosphate-dependent dehydrogenase E1 component subunit alpha [Tepidimicrobium xylanilyticum]|uniref:Pyruvate dehydrogenase E1 component alpha subunit n=1 Tax=Tepidimicrobium xylanilyticum TaxID=1123352 RepID=A0A1H3D6Y3_9FIRM|nr:thiamine pyrophosphate-dependent dehydrogenase E1 component subunit alpha [Tepidimicrobium xylanilyticum]GMG97917.1 pyruvate dehydrogenase (acetyl-transferring) E1 component subunit alpha [Tepidimicrobium xylanilyticum]SDX61898.1 pyruvate dehydrogenase E1 component alpha subunit [Tepidimicrobium xylanilyticum]
MVDISRDILLEMYKRMNEARAFENKVSYFFARGMVHGTTHLSIGQEASGIASCMALREDDYITSTHRGHSQVIGKGIDLNRMMAELLGKYTGYCKGKGGSMHIADVEAGNLGANGVVGGGIAIAVGAALTQQMKKTGRLVLCFFGDGATNEGSFHESLNLASVWKLPVIFFCENNFYGMSVPQSKSMNIKNIADRAKSYGMPGYTIDGNDAIEVYKTVKEVAEYVRSGNGPVLIESRTYRWLGHSKSDAQVYRTKEEIEEWKAKCPIKRLRNCLLENKIATEEELDKIEKKAVDDIEKAVEFANESPEPPLEILTEDVYA